MWLVVVSISFWRLLCGFGERLEILISKTKRDKMRWAARSVVFLFVFLWVSVLASCILYEYEYASGNILVFGLAWLLGQGCILGLTKGIY
jgi:hypothetical protein